MNCWICGANADTGEHRVKASDLRAIFRSVSQNRPLFLHTEQKRNQLVKGIKAGILKSRARLCATCNNQRTQPHDRAWERLSCYLRSRGRPLRVGDRIHLHKVFPGSVRKSMLSVHLYFVKRLGCEIAEHNVPINLGSFSGAILQEGPHPNVYLAICPQIEKNARGAGGSDITAVKVGERIVYAVWFYILDKFTVRVIYAEFGERRRGLVNAWHPSKISKCLQIGAN